MKKYFYVLALLAMSMGFVACDDNEEEKDIPEGTNDPRVTIVDNNLDVTSSNVNAWMTYAEAVANLLQKDAEELNYAWSVDFVKDNASQGAFAETFRNHNKAPYTSALACVQQVIDGCIDIASEVGTAKIGEPRDLWMAGKYTEAVYAVESWYSFHSINDYSNNIVSIRNAFNGTRNGNEAEHSLAKFTAAQNATLYNDVKSRIDAAYNAIKNGMKAPFRSYIGSNTVLAAQNACAELVEVLENDLTKFVNANADNKELDAIVENYVDNVVLPTYQDLQQQNTQLHEAIQTLKAEPSTKNFELAAQAWMAAREPWETSEAFLFGPVDELNLDPNMDSWPLDVDAIKEVLVSGNIEKLIQWSDEDDDEKIEAVQNVLGFHTLEFLLFKSGKPRTFEK